MKVRLVRFFGDSDRARIERHVDSAIVAWSNAWFCDSRATVRSVVFVPEGELKSGLVDLMTADGRQANVGTEPLPIELFFGRGRPKGEISARRRLEMELTRRSFRDLLERIIGPADPNESFSPGRAGQGCRIMVGIGEQEFPICFSGACFHARAAGTASLRAVRPVLQNTHAPAALKVVLEQTRLPLADVFRLRSGDVIALNSPLTGKAMLETVDGSFSVGGVLGARHGHKAIKVGVRE